MREAARAQVTAGRQRAFVLLEEALQLAASPPERARIALEVAEAYAALFRWADAVDVLERALAELNGADQELAARLEGELVVCGLHDARRADRVAPMLARLSSRLPQAASEPLAVAQAMAMLLAGRPAGQIGLQLAQDRPGLVARAESAFFFADELPAVRERVFGPAEASRVTQPALVVLGGDSARLTPLVEETVRRLSAMLPRARTQTLPDCTHLMPLQQPASLARLIIAFTDTIPRAAGTATGATEVPPTRPGRAAGSEGAAGKTGTPEDRVCNHRSLASSHARAESAFG